MLIFFKCSFTSSKGFKIGKYDTHTQMLSFVSEKSGENSEMPKKIKYTLSNELGRSLLLATDEKGDYFFGAYRIVEGTEGVDAKYVNAVFYDPQSPENIFRIYDYFGTHQKTASQILLDSIRRKDSLVSELELEFTVVTDEINKLLDCLSKDFPPVPAKTTSPNTIIAFITTGKLTDFQTNLEKFSFDEKMVLCENYHTQNQEIQNYQLAIPKNTAIPLTAITSAIPLPVKIGIFAVVAIFIVVLVSLFLH